MQAKWGREGATPEVVHVGTQAGVHAALPRLHSLTQPDNVDLAALRQPHIVVIVAHLRAGRQASGQADRCGKTTKKAHRRGELESKRQGRWKAGKHAEGRNQCIRTTTSTAIAPHPSRSPLSPQSETARCGTPPLEHLPS
jgi:hypothetical protein